MAFIAAYGQTVVKKPKSGVKARREEGLLGVKKRTQTNRGKKKNPNEFGFFFV